MRAALDADAIDETLVVSPDREVLSRAAAAGALDAQLVLALGEVAPASHLNFVIANGIVVVPVYGTPTQDTAIEALQAVGKEVTTVEGLAGDEEAELVGKRRGLRDRGRRGS